MSGSALGAALEIPKSALDKIKEADDKLVKLQQTAKDTASSVKTSFANMEGGAKGFIGALDQIISKLGTIDTKAKGMSGSLNNIGATKAAQEVTQMNGAITKAAENIERMSASQKKVTNSADFAKSISDWQNLQTQIDATSKRQQELTNFMRQYEMEQQRIRSGKGGVISRDDQANYASAQKEFEANKNIISSLREKQQQIINNNQALSRQIELVKSLRTYGQDYSFTDKRYKAEMQQLKEAIQLRAKKAAESQKQSNKEQAASDKEAKAVEKAEERKRAAWAKSTAAYGQQYHNERQAMYNQLFSTRNTTVPTAIANSQSATTLRDHIAAIKELQQARLNLVTTDKNYKQNLATINEAIKQHSKVLKDAGLNARNLGEQYSYLSGYLSRLAQRTAVVFSMSAAKNFVENVAEVRGQMEMSQRSLESILQNKPKADEIFNKTVELAVKSPFRIKDLVDYTRQLSAYRIESDKLYDTTKRLADVSAGLGVDMGRLILAYGQVKAAAYLRGSEVRQFTEAGINMYGELQQYFKEVKGEAYTTAQIVDMISKRKVTFEDVEAIFQRMTDKGGTFYNMQEVQAETLQGKISNLHDAFDVMLNDIGKANEGTFKGMISSATELLDNWQNIATVAKYIIELLVTIKLQSMLAASETGKMFARYVAANNAAGIGKIALGFKMAFEQIATAAKAAGAAIKGALPIMALMTAIEIFTSLSDSAKEYSQNLAKSMDTYAKSMTILNKSKDAYKVAVDIDGKNGKSKREDEIKKLVSEIEKQGYAVEIPVKFSSQQEADETFNQLTEKYRKFIDDIMEMDAIRAKNIKDSWGPGENMDEDMSDYENSYNEIISYTTRWTTALENVKQNYQYLVPEAKKAIDAVGSESDYRRKEDYLEAVYNALQKAKNGFVTFGQMSDVQRQRIKGSMEAVRSAIEGANASMFSSLRNDKEEVLNETKGLFDVLSKYVNDPKEIMLRINRFAADNDYSETKKMLLTHLAEDKFNINLSVNENSVQNTIDYIDKTIQDFVDSKHYKINIDVSDIGDPLTEWKDFFGNMEKDQKKLKETMEWMENIRSKGKGKDGLFHVDAGKFTDDELKLLGVNRPMKTQFGSWAKEQKQEITISADQVEKLAKERLKGIGDVFNNWGWQTKDDKKNARKHQKELEKNQRDILQEKINLLKDYNAKYEELQDHMNDEAAQKEARNYFRDAARNVGWNIDDIDADYTKIIAKIKQLAMTTKDIGKRGTYLRIAADIQAKWDKKYNEQQLDEAKKDVEDAFSKLDLFKKLREEGLNKEQIDAMFGDLTTSFEDARKRITDTFEAKYGKDHNSEKWGDKETKEYDDAIKKLDEKVAQDQVAQAQELIKAYKTQLTEQLQLDKWYYSERMKIRENANLKKDPELQKQLEENLTSQFKKKQADIDWKNFQNSDTYIAIFENLEHTSTKALDYMIDKLRGVREQLKGLDPTQVKTITEQIEKLEQTKNAKNPFKAFTSGYKEMIKANKEFKKNGGIDAWVKINKQNDAEKKDVQASDDRVAQLETEYNQAMKNNELTEEQRNNLKTNLNFEKAINAQKKAQNANTQKQVDELNNAKGASEKAKNKFSTSVTDITNMVSAMGSAFAALGQNLGIADDTFSNSVNLIDHAGQAIGSFYSKNWAGVVSNAVGAIGDVINLFSSESKIDKEIERQERAVTRLQNAYSNLKQSMDDAFDIERLQEYHNKSVETLEDEKKAYEAMIRAEQGRKNPDDGKIEQWQQEIQNLDKTIKELGESLTESLGGFGSEANYKSAAQEFADAWVDAFNDGSDALDALNDKFDDFYTNMLKKQLMQRATERFIKPILDAFDEAVSEGSDGGNNGYELTKEELAHIKDLKESNLKAFDEYARNLMDVLGVTPSGSSNLSNLQQGIQAVTETTAQALESILNSMRYYVSQQQSDVAAIRMILEQRLGAVAAQSVEGGASNQMLSLMEQQAGYLKQICDNWSSVMKSGHKQGGKGLKVFMN